MAEYWPHSFVHFSWQLFFQEKLKTMLMQIFGGKLRVSEKTRIACIEYLHYNTFKSSLRYTTTTFIRLTTLGAY